MNTRQLAKRPKNPARKSPNLRELLASALLALREAQGMAYDRELLQSIPSEKACKAIISAFETDHWPIPVALGGTNHPCNLKHLLKADHRHKTAKIDQPAIAKAKRLSKDQEEMRVRLLAKSGQGVEPVVEGRRKSSFACGRNSAFKKKMSGETVRR